MEFNKNRVLESIKMLCEESHKTATEKGWHDTPREIGTELMLICCEAAETMEAIREGNPTSKKIPDFSHAEEELADICIRVFDLSSEHKFNLACAILAKMEYNKGRSYRHGGKQF